MKKVTFLCTAATIFAASISTASAAPARLSIDMGKPGAKISPLLYGAFFEEISRAGDGGIYAEMIQNRSFEDADFPIAWTLIKGQATNASVALDKASPLNANNPTSLRLSIPENAGGRVGIVNNGFTGVPQRGRREEWLPAFERATGGIAVQQGKTYDLSFYARGNQGFAGPLVASLESKDGRVLASRQVTTLGANWKKFTVSLSATGTEANASLVLSATTPGTVWLDMVSLFPRDTWKGRKNGLRADLMNTIAAMKPAFMRFPGGCFVEGGEIEDRFRWKETIGDIAQRPGHFNHWGYRSTNGLGFHEYLQMCEDLGAEPLYVQNAGMSHHQGRLNAYAVPMAEMGPYVQEAVDAIEYANGPVTSKWGAMRAQNGHPKPFNIKMIQIGNENGGPAYNERYALFHDAIKAKYPKMQLIACDWGGVPNNRPLDIFDPHLYSNPQAMLMQAGRFDNADRKGPDIYFGEYAVTEQAGTGNLQAAVAEAAFMTGFERNGDIVTMSSYAPLLAHANWKAWNPNAIIFDQSRSYTTPSYYVQSMFGSNRADVNFPVQIEQPSSAPEDLRGRIGVGTWATTAEFKDITVTQGDRTLFASDFSQGLPGWKTTRGKWQAADGVLRQTGDETDTLAIVGDPNWRNYTLRLKARKISGNEGFLITFGSPDDNTRLRLNLGGWGNTAHGLEMPGMPTRQVPGRIETNRWYDIRIDLQGTYIKTYVDDKLIHNVNRVVPMMFAIAGRDNKTGETILKVVNSSRHAAETTIDLRGVKKVAPQGKALVLTSASPLDENSFAAPHRVVPRAETIRLTASSFQRTFPAHSVTILRLKATR